MASVIRSEDYAEEGHAFVGHEAVCLQALVAEEAGGFLLIPLFDALGMRDYIWRYPRGSYIQERWFDLGNPGSDNSPKRI